MVCLDLLPNLKYNFNNKTNTMGKIVENIDN